MYARQEAIAEVLKAIKKALGKGFSVSADDLDEPPNPALGDVAFPVFEYAKKKGRNPVEVATEMAAKIGPTAYIEKVVSAGPYVNFYFSPAKMAERVIMEIDVAAEKYGIGKLGKGKTILVEYAQPNTHKEFHVGHVRNALLGQSIINILRENGYKVIAASYPGDIGAHVAKVIWAIQKFHPDEEILVEDRTKRLQEIYEEATKYLEDHEEAKTEVAEVQRKLEARENPEFQLWKETREWSIEEFKRIFAELGVEPDVWYYESEVEEEGKEIVKSMLKKGIAKKSDGATIVDLEDEGLGVFLVLKSDGSALYATKDLALAYHKKRDFKPDRQMVVVDNRQSLYFQQLFATLKRLGFTESLSHLSYDMVTLPDGAMSSRKGNIVRYVDLHQTLVERLAAETKKRHEDWSEKDVDEVARAIARSALAFMMLRQDPASIITFDIDEALSVDGFTGPYLLYTAARIQSVIDKAEVKPKWSSKKLVHIKEQNIVRQLALYPEIVQRAGQTYQVSLVATYAFDLAKAFAEYYHEVTILDAEDKEGTAARLALIAAVRQVLANACKLLTIPIIKEM